MNHTGAALAGVTADMRTSQTKCFSKERYKKRIIRNVMAYRLAIHLH